MLFNAVHASRFHFELCHSLVSLQAGLLLGVAAYQNEVAESVYESSKKEPLGAKPQHEPESAEKGSVVDPCLRISESSTVIFLQFESERCACKLNPV